MDVKKTISSIFILPLLGIPREGLLNNNCINGYIIDIEKDVQYPDSLYVLFKPENIDRFREFVDKEYERTQMLIDDYDYEDGFVVLVYRIEGKYDKDIELVKQGKYSKTSTAFQNKFPKVLKITNAAGKHKDELSLQYRVFKKTPDLREYWENKTNESFSDDMEVWPGWNENEEILDLDKIKKQLYESI